MPMQMPCPDCPVDQTPEEDEDITTSYLVQQIELLPVAVFSLKAGTMKDAELSKIVTFAQ